MLEQTIKDQRIVLTKKYGKKFDSFTPELQAYILEGCNFFVVDSEKRYNQPEEAIKKLDLKISEEDLMTRCLTCNELLDRLNCKNCGATKSKGDFSQWVIKKLMEVCKLMDCHGSSIESSKNDRAATSDTQPE